MTHQNNSETRVPKCVRNDRIQAGFAMHGGLALRNAIASACRALSLRTLAVRFDPPVCSHCLIG
jgi:hypothetical protein